jgi:hypothetical protein
VARIKVHAGDFLKSDGSFSSGNFTLKTDKHVVVGENIPLSQLAEIAVASEENVKKFAGTSRWGSAGAIFLGQVGLLAGLLAGKRQKQVTFVARFNDGRELMATTDTGTYTTLVASEFEA